MNELVLRGIKENNLQNISLSIPHDQLVVITGVSGSGKSTLAFDTIYAEGGRRYIETFSPYTRQFLDRLQPPKLDSVEGVRPALALEQRNRITSSRSTVGTVTEINDYLKLLWSQFAELICEHCQQAISRQPVETVVATIRQEVEKQSFDYLILSFDIALSGSASLESLKTTLLSEGHIRYLDEGGAVQRIEALSAYPSTKHLRIVVDRISLNSIQSTDSELTTRLRSSIAQGYAYGQGMLQVHFHAKTLSQPQTMVFSEAFHCANCSTSYPAPKPSLFSFNSPIGACIKCHGFGKILEVDRELCIADHRTSIKDGAIACWDTDATSHLKKRLLEYCRATDIPTDAPWRTLSKAQQTRVFEGDKEHGYKGVEAWFARLEKKRHKMHVRVLLSRYRSEHTCPQCAGTRLKPLAQRYFVAGKTLPDIWALPVEEVLTHLLPLRAHAKGLEVVETAVAEVLSRLQYLCDIGLPYLSLDRQSRTLSGGESQRVNLTSLLGARLVHTMLVLDEPTIGLHPRDTSRLLEILQQLRNRGNSLVVVEHDPEVMRAADHIIDLGPDAGTKGGQIVASGTLTELLASKTSRTARYLAAPTSASTRRATLEERQNKLLIVKNAHANNLQHLDVSIPLERLVCITGASGSGKSTLVHDCLYTAYQQLRRGTPKATLRKSKNIHLDSLEGLAQLDAIVLIDQSPIGKSPRSNPATYTKAWDYARELLADTDAAVALGLSKSAFSFNVEGGRCPACKGAGQTKVEMQFLADVYVQCDVCNGSRFQESVLGVRIAGKNVVELLNTSIEDALELLESVTDSDTYRKFSNALQPLIALGLGYLRLGHPLNALSGGEAQRVKLASYLADSAKQTCLFILDEPTTGLHPDNIKDLITTFDVLLSRGHSVLCIEHNLDVLAQADHIIDLGPDGGSKGGQLLLEGRPGEIAAAAANYPRSSTAQYLAAYFAQENPLSENFPSEAQKTPSNDDAEILPFRPRSKADTQEICIQGAREHNLKNVSLSLPQNKIIAITGVSGSGKSTLAFDILFAEGQRRYINCLSPYARQYIKQLAQAEVDQVRHIPPTIAISQKTAPPHGISTVATTTELYQFLRLLFAKAGQQHCVVDNTPITSRQTSTLVDQLARTHSGKRVLLFAPVISGRKGYYNDLFNRALKAGITEAKIDGAMVSLTPDLRLERHKLHYISLAVASLRINAKSKDLLRQAVEQCLVLGNGVLELYQDDVYGNPEIVSIDRVCPSCNRGYRELDPQDFSFRSARGVCTTCSGRGVIQSSSHERSSTCCPDCQGARIAEIGRHVYFAGKSIHALTQHTPSELLQFLRAVDVDARLSAVVDPILREMIARLETITAIGLDYLPLNRDASSLSGGEAQRLRLAKTLGSPLTGVCYILDEPSIGLHSQDHAQLLQTLQELKSQGNTVVIVEHDEDSIRAADHVVDVGPGGGRDGGSIVFQGTVAALTQCAESRTGQALQFRELPKPRSFTSAAVPEWIELRGAHSNNLRDIDVRIPLGSCTVVCGVSGAGKSSLVHGTLVPAIVELMEGEKSREEFYDKTWQEISGADSLERFLEIDQSPVGKTSSSAPVSYLGIFDHIRKIYAMLPEAKARGWTASHFSFNTGKGRCPHCEGKGAITIPMSFLPDASTPCEFCNGMRYTEETLEIHFQGVSIGTLLQSTFTEAYELFQNHRLVQRSIEYVLELGLGYLSLGQPTHTLSGGEAQRIKIARELGGREAKNTLYVLDEPTIGLHMLDVDKLRSVVQRLVDQGNTVVIIEHNLDIIRSADYLIELGPGPGDRGGSLLFQGAPAQLAKQRALTPTSRFLKQATQKRQKQL